MPNTYERRATALTNLLALIDGTEKHPADTPARLANVAYTNASLVQLLQSLADAMTARNAAVTKARDALSARRAVEALVGPVLSAYRRYLLAAYGDVTTLADYGLVPPKERTPPTVEAQAQAVARRRATRKARGTKGPRARLAIKASREPEKQ
jgi:hypothetical protein